MAMKLNKNALFFLMIFFPLVVFAQAEVIFNGIQLNESMEIVTKKIKNISKTSAIITVDNPSFPLAKNKESHLVCSKIRTENGIISNAVFTFVDNKLTYIEARGNAVKTLADKRKDTARQYMDYDVYFNDNLFLGS